MEKIVLKNIQLVKKFDGRVYFSLSGNEKELGNWTEFNSLGKKLPFTKDTILVDLIGENEIDPKNNKTKFKIKAIEVEGIQYKREVIQVVKKEEPTPLSTEGKKSNYTKYSTENKTFNSAAIAPYNFVPLNEKVIKVSNSFDDFSKFEGNSGYIEVSIINKTPFFIRGKGDDFFKIGDKTSISGSSFRGLIRTMVEMMSYSKFQFTNKNLKLFMRFIASQTQLSVKKEYYQRMGIDENAPKGSDYYKANAGFLNFDNKNKKYYIIESISKKDNDKIESDFFEKGKKGKKKGQEEFNYEDDGRCFIIYSGFMFKKKRHSKISYPADTEKKINVPDVVINDYREDKNREEAVFNLLDLAKTKRHNGIDLRFGVPVFYTTNSEGKIDSFGHTKYYRLPYYKEIGDNSHIPNIHDDTTTLDFAESIFGIVENDNIKSGKVFFEDLEIVEEKGEGISKRPKILNEPKPTSFQLYLEQPQGANTSQANLKHWDSENAMIRGYKQYWHRITPNDSTKYGWQEDPTKIRPKVNPEAIKPLNEATEFKGRIRFENLTDEELGALLCAINLPAECCHKLGMAKSLGLGSVRVNATLKIVNRVERYNFLFDDNKDFIDGVVETDNSNQFVDSFKKYILENINETAVQDFWELSRMKQLRKMLFFDKNAQNTHEWLEKTRYMMIEKPINDGQKVNEYKNRTVLPKPTEIL